MTRTCIDTIKEQVTRGLKIERELVWKPKKKGEGEINEESLRENQGRKV